MRPCPLIAEEPEAEDETSQGVEDVAAPATSSVQNEPNAAEGNAADAIEDRAEYRPTPLSTAAPRVGNPCHRADETPSAYHGFQRDARDVKTFGHANHQEASAANE